MQPLDRTSAKARSREALRYAEEHIDLGIPDCVVLSKETASDLLRECSIWSDDEYWNSATPS